jgi:hypothetical protein
MLSRLQKMSSILLSIAMLMRRSEVENLMRPIRRRRRRKSKRKSKRSGRKREGKGRQTGRR